MNITEAGGDEHYQGPAAVLEGTEIPDSVARALALGWSVIPCRPDKRPCLSWRKFQKVRATEEEIRSWQATYNPSAWAVITGAVSGVVVLDFDGETGNRTRAALKLTPHVKTGSGGSHVYVDHPGWGTRTVNGKSKQILGEQFPGLDIRGDGGYAVFCGQNESGSYQWVREMRPDPLDTVPSNLRALLGLLHPPEGGAQRPPASTNIQSSGRVAADRLIGRALEQAGGGRNDAGFWLAAQLRDNVYSRAEAEAILSEFASRVPPSNSKGHDEPYTRAEALASVEQAYQHSPREPWPKPRPRVGVKSPVATVPSQHPRAADLAGFRFTDLASAELMTTWHGRDLRYCHVWHKWLAWDGKRWKVDDTGAVVRRAANTVRSLYDVAAAIEDRKERERLVRHALSYEAKKKLYAMIGLAESQLDIVVVPDQLDRDKWLLNVDNGTLDLRTGELREHRREDLITKLAPVPYDPEAKAPLFEKFLNDIFAGNQDVIRFVQRGTGYALTGDTSEQCLFIAWGDGENGKSTLIETILSILGDYAMFTPPETLLAKRHDGIPNDLARLKGARFVAAVETEEGKYLAESRIKQMTGGDTISARFMRGEWFDFKPEFKCFLATNHKPAIRGTDHAIWRRIRLVPFSVRIPSDKQDKHLKEKLSEELPGVLAWAVRGCFDWQNDGLRPPDEVTQATAAYRDENDQVGRFVGECCVIGEYFQAKARPLYQEYRRWATEVGEEILTETAFARRLAERRFEKKRRKTGNVYIGIGLTAREEAERV